MRLAFIGLGIMGSPMAVHLAKAGHQLAVFNRTRSREQPLVELGAISAPTPADAVHGVEIVHLCLKNQDVVRDAVFQGGLLAAMQPGQILVDHGTSGVALARELARAGSQRRVDVVDAPISGGYEGARDATLAIMAGGEADVFERVRPLLETMGTTVRHVGPAGSGQALKLANQLLCVVNQFAAAEAYAFARKAGVDGRLFGEVILNAWGRSFMLERAMPNFLAGDHAGGRTSLTTYMKDIRLLADSALELGQRIDLSERATALLQEAVDAGLAESDITSALELYSQQA